MSLPTEAHGEGTRASFVTGKIVPRSHFTLKVDKYRCVKKRLMWKFSYLAEWGLQMTGEVPDLKA